MDKKRTGKDEGFNIDLGFGKFQLGGLTEGIEKIIDLANKLNEAGGSYSSTQQVDLDHIKKGMNAVFGISVKSGIRSDEGTVVESFGNIRQTSDGPKVEPRREPMTDIFDESAKVTIVMEMPGVVASDIAITLKGDILEVSCDKGSRLYYKEVLLPSPVDEGSMKWEYLNGMLEIILAKA
ncbi:Hsp20/alpha crystallin family protein [Prosthecochloris sp. CIB 2401]|uniref:Hsp20/alpha crystallin family protein n=1 Tax=Prosthecochloris sp. CIB 2401 TaxID=1868325 RepID=UPI00080AA4A8|nr:Hsp20/alpha crystallin family protein [Prosthecochloris sp. CIB 2401]ANT64684.1 CS domain protein [Prosthecochloris sp. CIB 2401]